MACGVAAVEGTLWATESMRERARARPSRTTITSLLPLDAHRRMSTITLPLEAEVQVDRTRAHALLDHSWRRFD